MCVCMHLSLSRSLSLCMSVYMFVCMCMSVYISVSGCVCLCLCLCLSVSVFEGLSKVVKACQRHVLECLWRVCFGGSFGSPLLLKMSPKRETFVNFWGQLKTC